MPVLSPASSNLATTGCSYRLKLMPRQVACASYHPPWSPLHNATSYVVRRYLLRLSLSTALIGSVCNSVIARNEATKQSMNRAGGGKPLPYVGAGFNPARCVDRDRDCSQ